MAQDETASIPPDSPGESSASVFDDGRIAPGTMLGDRYRVVTQLGRGGMGEVYRADDLTLGQSVALKFLPDAVAADPVKLERLRAEVRLARQVSHPSVCRVFDIGEAGGRQFIAMEYIDGEDLSALLRRIGRMPGERAVEIARQICAGLAAAHDVGIIHRDLKPANIMIDGRGRARITDFGVAGIAEELQAAEGAFAGTPAYMAPEQRARGAVSKRSDIYSLGLVLYELFTGKRPFPDGQRDRSQSHASSVPPTSPSSIVTEIDPATERVIMQCLEYEPEQRPSNALALLAALPGGDPLQAMLEAGETPSPELIAASGRSGSLSKVTALVIALLILAIQSFSFISDARAPGHEYMRSILPPEVLRYEARQILNQLGYTDQPASAFHGFGRRSFAAASDDPEETGTVVFRDLGDDTQGGIWFWYREHTSHFRPLLGTIPSGNLGERVRPTDPATNEPGMKSMQLTPQGRLLWLKAVIAPEQIAQLDDGSEPDWDSVLDTAGFEGFSLQPAEPVLRPDVAWSTRKAWHADPPQAGSTRIHIEAAALGQRITYFSVSHANDPIATRPWGDEPFGFQSGNLAITFISLVIGGVLAVHNIRRGRGDRKGALRLFVVFFIIAMLGWVVSTSHTKDFQTESKLLISGLSYALARSALACLVYLGLEPFIRRAFPRALIGWSRLLAGRLRDPLVGRDVLIGLALASFFVVMGLVGETIADGPPLDDFVRGMPDPAVHLSMILRVPISATTTALTLATVFVIVKLLVRGPSWLAPTVMVVTTVAIFQGPRIAAGVDLIDITFNAIGAASVVTVLYRFGLIPIVLAITIMEMSYDYLSTFDPAAWYALPTQLFVAFILTLLVYGFTVSTAGQPWSKQPQTDPVS